MLFRGALFWFVGGKLYETWLRQPGSYIGACFRQDHLRYLQSMDSTWLKEKGYNPKKVSSRYFIEKN